MTKDQIQSLIASHLSKQAEEGPGHEAAETPNAEMLEHAMGAGGEEQPHGSGPGGVDVEQLLSQLSPEELQQLIAELSAGHAGGEAPGAAPGGDDVAGLSQNIESHLAQNPEAQVPGAPPEKMAALDLVKSANYIEGFIKQAMTQGYDINEAVSMYDNALTSTVEDLRKEAGSQDKLYKAFAKKQKTDKLKANLKAPFKYVADKAKAGFDTIKKHPKTSAGVAGAAAVGVGGYAASKKSSDKEKQAAYLEGIFKQAMAYGFSEAEAYEVVKEAADKNMFQRGVQQARIAGKKALRAVKSAPAAARGALASSAAGAQEHLIRNKSRYIAGAGLAAGGAAGYAAGKSSDKEKQAAYLEGIFKQAMARGFSEAEAVQFAQQAEASL